MDDLQKLLENAGVTEGYDFGYSIELTDTHVIIREEGHSQPPGGAISMPIDSFESIIESFFEQMG